MAIDISSGDSIYRGKFRVSKSHIYVDVGIDSYDVVPTVRGPGSNGFVEDDARVPLSGVYLGWHRGRVIITPSLQVDHRQGDNTNGTEGWITSERLTVSANLCFTVDPQIKAYFDLPGLQSGDGSAYAGGMSKMPTHNLYVQITNELRPESAESMAWVESYIFWKGYFNPSVLEVGDVKEEDAPFQMTFNCLFGTDPENTDNNCLRHPGTMLYRRYYQDLLTGDIINPLTYL